MRKVYRLGTVLLFYVFFITIPILSAEDFSLWLKRMPITFSGYTNNATLTNFPALIVLEETDTGLGFYYSDFLSPPYGDLRFVAYDRMTPLNFEVETWDTGDKSYVWVRIPELTQDTKIYALWGMAGANTPPPNVSEKVWHDGFAGVWHLNDSDNVYDSTVNKNHGTPKGGVNIDVNGITGSALAFNGSNGYIDCGSGLMMHYNSITLSVWFKTDELPTSEKVIIGKSVNSNTGQRYFISMSDLFRARFRGSSLVTASTACLPSHYDNTWHQLTAVFNRKDDLKLFLDGELMQSASMASQVGYDMDRAYKFFIGVHANSSGNAPLASSYFLGSLDEARMMMEAVPDDWVWATYQNMAENNSFNSHGEIVSHLPVGTVYVFW